MQVSVTGATGFIGRALIPPATIFSPGSAGGGRARRNQPSRLAWV